MFGCRGFIHILFRKRINIKEPNRKVKGNKNKKFYYCLLLLPPYPEKKRTKNKTEQKNSLLKGQIVEPNSIKDSKLVLLSGISFLFFSFPAVAHKAKERNLKVDNMVQ